MDISNWKSWLGKISSWSLRGLLPVIQYHARIINAFDSVQAASNAPTSSDTSFLPFNQLPFSLMTNDWVGGICMHVTWPARMAIEQMMPSSWQLMSSEVSSTQGQRGSSEEWTDSTHDVAMPFWGRAVTKQAWFHHMPELCVKLTDSYLDAWKCKHHSQPGEDGYTVVLWQASCLQGSQSPNYLHMYLIFFLLIETHMGARRFQRPTLRK